MAISLHKESDVTLPTPNAGSVLLFVAEDGVLMIKDEFGTVRAATEEARAVVAPEMLPETPKELPANASPTVWERLLKEDL